MRRYGILALTIAMAGITAARGADQTILGNAFQVKDPGVATKRKVVGKATERASAETIVGDPVADGATVTVTLYGGTPTQQTFSLPQATSPITGKPFWSGDATKGFKYKDSLGENGPIKSAQIKRSAGVFSIKILAIGKYAAIALVPPNPGTSACIRLQLNGGDDYSVAFGPTSQITNKGSLLFKAKKPLAEGICPAAASTTTTSSSTTTTTGIVQCCVPDSVGGAFDCIVETPVACFSDGGIAVGAGTCAGDPCSALTTTTTIVPATSTTAAPSTTTSSSSSTTITLLPCGGLSPACLGSCPPGETCSPGQHLLDPCSCAPDGSTTTFVTTSTMSGTSTTTITLLPCGGVSPVCLGSCPPGETCSAGQNLLDPCSCVPN